MIFDIRNNKPVVTPEALYSIPEIRNIWDRDTTDEKLTAQKELAYVYHMAEPKSVYSKLPRENKETEIINDIFGGKYRPDKEVQLAIDKYKELRETAALRLLKSSINACDKLSSYFDDIDFVKRDDAGRPLYTAKDVASNLEKVGKIRESLIKLEQTVEKEEEQAPKIKKGVTPNMFQS